MIMGEALESARTLPDLPIAIPGPFEEQILAGLEAAGAISGESAERARRAHARTRGSLVDILIRLGLCEEKVLAQQVASVLGLKLFDPEATPPIVVRPGAISVPFLREARVLPIADAGS